MKILLFLLFLSETHASRAAAAGARHTALAGNLPAKDVVAGTGSADRDPLMGSVVKSDKWKMDRKNNLEFFDGAVSFKNPSYTMRSDHAIYNHSARLWDIYGSAYILRKFPDSSKVEINCEKGKYFETGQTAFFERGSRQIRMKYYFPDETAGIGKGIGREQQIERTQGNGREQSEISHSTFPPNSSGGPAEAVMAGTSTSVADSVRDPRQASVTTFPKELRGLADKAKAENVPGLMSFEGDFSLATENLYMLSQKGLYRDSEKSFLMYESTPVAVGVKEGYDFAVNAEKMKFFRDSRDIKFYNNVSGWVKEAPLKR